MKALLLVDIQNDFLPGGALPVPEGDAVVPLANALQRAFPLVVATRDWHPANHGSFAANHPGRKPGQVVSLSGLSQILWPAHCVQHSPGAEFASGLRLERLDKVFFKGADPEVDSYSGFFDNGRRHSTFLGAYLKSREVVDLYVLGLATDYCVKFTALDAVSLGFRTFLVEDACRGVNLRPNDVANALAEMKRAGVVMVRSGDVLAAATSPPVRLEEAVTLGKGRFLRLRKLGRWEFAERVNTSVAVAVVAVTEESKLLLVEQYRAPIGQRVIELPAGLSGDAPGAANEPPAAAAARELLEETGYAARELTCLVTGPPSAGMSSELVAFFRAAGLRRVTAGGGHGDESIVVHEVPLSSAIHWLQERAKEGVLVDPKVYAGLLFALRGRS
jgi:nicotinamidase/pyrazinamidase